jgi:predicted DNA-binding transcriptional regulator AlpA
MSRVTDEPLLDVDGLARFLGLPSRRAVYNRRHRGTLPPAILVGRSLRWRERDVKRWLEQQTENRDDKKETRWHQ